MACVGARAPEPAALAAAAPQPPALNLLLGVIAQLVATIGTSAGQWLAYAAWRYPEKRARLWTASFVCTFIFGVGGDFAALTMIPISLVAPLGSLVNVWNAFVYGAMHGRGKVPVVSVIVIVASCVVVAATIPRVPQAPPDARRVTAAAVAACFPIALLFVSYDWIVAKTKWSAAIPGVVAGFTQMLFKTFAAFVEIFYSSPECRDSAQLGVRILAFGLCAGVFGAVQFFMTGLMVRNHSPLAAFPLYWATIVVSSELIGAFALGEFSGASLPPPIFFVAIVACVAGVWRMGADADAEPHEYREIGKNIPARKKETS